MSERDNTEPDAPQTQTERRVAPPGAGRPRTAVGAGASFEYRGRWGLVTGASMGIGEAFAWALAERGMNVVLCARSEDRLRALAAAIEREQGVRTQVVVADLARPGAPADAWARASDGRDIHLLVNNAGFGARGRFDALPMERQGEMVALNCTALLELAHLALGPMRARAAGGILNVASIVAFQPVPLLATYAATKAFVFSLSEAMAEENRGSGVRILCVSPGPTPSGFQATAGTRVREGQLGYMRPREVADAALAALDAGKTHVAPGFVNHLSTIAGRILPLRAVIRVAKMINQRR